MKVYLVTPYGWCSGVKKSISLAEKILQTKGEVYTLGALVHNPKVIEDLERKGIKIWNNKSIPEGKKLIVRAHGLPYKEVEKYKEYGNEIYDATCPLVKKVQKLAEFLKKNGYKVLIVGEKKHPEVIGIMSYAEEKGIVIENINDAIMVESFPKIGIVIQTTQSWEEVEEIIKLILTKGKEIRIFNTICPEVEKRQEKAKILSEMVELVLVLGGRNSANTRRLYNILVKSVPTYHIENLEEIDMEWFDNKQKIGIITGTSTPDAFVEEVLKLLETHHPLEIHLV
uniref:4-hydroxy-3-methylbut-2-enyl diphosphate reductase n=1 Tax=Dictyoglomus thermophilum TaxID=14 RepID=A0A7C3MJ50_DICTH